jgi:glucans biosynthesis protein
MCEQLLEIYMRQLGLLGDGQPSALDAAEPPRVKRRRAPASADSCGARLRDGALCARPPVEGRRRCRSHGCAPRTGAPKGNRNALKHGCFSAAELARNRQLNEFIRECRDTLRQFDDARKGPR